MQPVYVARYLLWSGVCLSVWLSQSGVADGASFPLILYYVAIEFEYAKRRVLLCGTLSQTLNLAYTERPPLFTILWP